MYMQYIHFNQKKYPHSIPQQAATFYHAGIGGAWAGSRHLPGVCPAHDW